MNSTLNFYQLHRHQKEITNIYNGDVKNTIASQYENFKNYAPADLKLKKLKNSIVINDKYTGEKIATITFKK